MEWRKKLEELKKSENLWMLMYVSVITYVTSVITFTLLFIAAPLLVQSGNSLLLGFGAAVYNIISDFVMCHQLPQRSLFLLDAQFPVCARCLGQYVGISIGGLAALFLKLPRFFRSKKMLLLLTLPMAVDGVSQTMLYARESSNILRVVTGFMFGFGLLYFVTSRIAEKSKMIKTGREDAWKIAVVVNAIMLIAIMVYGVYLGANHVSRENALSMALSEAGTDYENYAEYYIPPNALRNARNDPYLRSYNDVMLKDLAKIRYDEHSHGVWAIALLDEQPKREGKTVFMSETRGTYVYIDSISGETVYLRKVGETASSGKKFTIIALSDTQWYSQNYPQIFRNQTEWIAGQARERSIAFVVHSGDIVNSHNSEKQWENADASMSVLDGMVPYGLAPGNHDTPTVWYNEYFPASRYLKESWYGGNYSGNDNSYQLFSALGEQYMVVNLEFCPDSKAVDWANQVLENHKDRKAIVVTHAYLDSRAQRSASQCGSTQYIWDNLVSKNSNVFMVLCGHTHAEAMRSDKIGDRTVHQLLADYQDRPKGGDGWLRILEFHPDENKVYVKTYSPYLDEYETDGDSQFTLEI